MKKYAIHPGFVQSKQDNDVHYISFRKLVACYKISINECMLWEPPFCIGARKEDYIHLYPLHNGEYAKELKMRINEKLFLEDLQK